MLVRLHIFWYRYACPVSLGYRRRFQYSRKIVSIVYAGLRYRIKINVILNLFDIV